MKAYLLPLYERFIETTHFAHICECRHIDEVGVFIYHDGKKKITDDDARHYLVRRRRTECVVEAESVTDAIQKFYNEWEGAKVGGDSEMSKALWIDRTDRAGIPSTKLIEELPECVQMHKSKEDRITCGRPIYSIPDHLGQADESINMNGEFGMCGLDGYDYPEEGDCPMIEFSELRQKFPIRTVTVDGKEFRYISAKDLPEAKKSDEERKAKDERIKTIRESMVYKRLKLVEL